MRCPKPMPEDVSLRLLPEDWLGPLDLAGEWEQDGPRILDLGCGKGRFLLAHAARNPDARLLGVERKLRRIRKIDSKACRAGLRNIRILRMEAMYTLNHLMPENWIDICFVYFPDPWPKEKHHKNRIFGPEFLDSLDRVLSETGVVHFATDNRNYFEEVAEVLQSDSRWRPAEVYIPCEDEVSDFELVWRDTRPTNRLSFQRG
ncbi:MAG: tRNA (guanosine(46)-N7)-methyltransferase TrmB [Verrucomicrobia bacterium]|nr:tRNA (guanosine(46)-N7)-methyltransferase TrmB [Verrucomicrobiota bacterium]MCH8528972.1 tRNA (guanosine(46)-N7)-methyltransferase TrmB [Kiritimatiellia bacterium]